MDQQNNNPAPERHVPTEAEIARLEAEAAAALQRGDAIPSHAVTPDDAAQAEPQPVAPPVRPDFVPYVDDVPEPASTGTDAGEDAEDDDDDDTYIPSEMEKRIAAMTPEQWKRWQILGGGAVGIAIVICLFAFGQELATYGLIVAALLRQMITLGPGILSSTLSAILYLVLGALGYNIGKRRSREFMTMITRLSGAREKSKIRKHGYAARKFLDTSAIIDGRILEIAGTGFIEGEFVIPQFVVDELQHVADSADDSRRERGRRGLEILQEMKEKLRQLTIDDADIEGISDVDVKLLRQARDCGGTVITVDYNLQKAAAVSGVKALNVNELVEALRPTVIQGMELRIRVSREGKEAGQGVGYLSDGTMIVIEDGKKKIGEETDILVTSVLQTSAGRMVFARLKSEA